MARVILTGWKSGFSKVLLNKLLQQYCGMTLSDSKAAVDSLLEGTSVEGEFEGMGLANEFAEKARGLGALVDIRSWPSDPGGFGGHRCPS